MTGCGQSWKELRLRDGLPHQVGLRIPQEQNLLDPETLRPVHGKFAALVAVRNAVSPRRTPERGEQPVSSPQRLEGRSSKVIRLNAWQRLSKIEATYQGYPTGNDQ